MLVLRSKMFDPKFQVLLKFLQDNPERLSSRSKSLHLDSDEGINALHECYVRSKEQKLTLSRPATIPDDAVSVILQQCCNFTEEQTEQIKVEHQLSMSAENLVGALLERYIAQVLEPHGWIWCAELLFEQLILFSPKSFTYINFSFSHLDL